PRRSGSTGRSSPGGSSWRDGPPTSPDSRATRAGGRPRAVRASRPGPTTSRASSTPSRDGAGQAHHSGSLVEPAAEERPHGRPPDHRAVLGEEMALVGGEP